MGKIDVAQAVIIAQKMLSPEGFEHSLKVAEYALELKEIFSSSADRDTFFIMAILHDVLEDAPEDSKEKIEALFEDGLPKEMYAALQRLTHNKETVDYNFYCEKIKYFAMRSSYGEVAYIVKLADMKDHLSRRETLTDKLKEKYLTGLSYLL